MVVFMHFCILLPCRVFNGTAYPYPISGKHISTPPGPASLEACHSWFESLWETQTRRADRGFRSSGAMVLGWFLRWDESDTATGVLRGEIGKPLVAVVLDEF